MAHTPPPTSPLTDSSSSPTLSIPATPTRTDTPPPATKETLEPLAPTRPGRRRWVFACIVPLVLVFILGSSHQSGSTTILSVMASTTESDSNVPSFPSLPEFNRAHALSWIPSQLRRHHAVKRSPQLDNSPVSGTKTITATVSDPSASMIVGAHPVGNAAQSTSPSIPSTPLPVPTPFPQPWDTSLSFNFSEQPCLTFFTSMVANYTFRSCRSFALLLPASSQFFQIEGNLTELTATIGGTCATTTSAQDCQNVMNWFAGEVVKPTVCAKDLEAKHPVVLQALNGFKSYTLMRNAGCLINQRTNSYCFVDAVASDVGPADLYYYNLPLGNPLPPKTVPSCSACVQSLLALYASYANNATLPIHDTYQDAAKKANDQCGDSYAPTLSSFNGAASSRLLLGSAFGSLMIPLAIGIMSLLINVEVLVGFG